jgi:methionine-S-sulfoxide reductase
MPPACGSLVAEATALAAAGAAAPAARGASSVLFATFAGGCFWGLELAFQRAAGVVGTCVGYTDGFTPNPSYGAVCAETTGHCEAVLIAYDPAATSYVALAALFFDVVGDPTTLNRVGRDRGTQYRTALVYHSEAQLADARAALTTEVCALSALSRTFAASAPLPAPRAVQAHPYLLRTRASALAVGVRARGPSLTPYWPWRLGSSDASFLGGGVALLRAHRGDRREACHGALARRGRAPAVPREGRALRAAAVAREGPPRRD